MGESVGLTLRMVGGEGICGGSCRAAADMAGWTSCAAAAILRSRLNWMVMLVEPWLLDELMLLMPAMVENWLSSGVATAEAMVSGSAPGSEALTVMVGKSTLGSSLTGKGA